MHAAWHQHATQEPPSQVVAVSRPTARLCVGPQVSWCNRQCEEWDRRGKNGKGIGGEGDTQDMEQGRGDGSWQQQLVQNPNCVSSLYSPWLCTSKMDGTGPRRPIEAAEACPKVRGTKLPLPEETSAMPPPPQDIAYMLLSWLPWRCGG